MAKISLPQDFIDKFNDKNLTWFVKDGAIEYSSIIVTETVILQNVVEDTDIAIGIKYETNTYVYHSLRDIKSNGDGTFDITVGDIVLKTFKLIAMHNIIDNITKNVDVDNLTKIVHLAKGMKGEQGKPGKSAYDLYKEHSGSDISETEFKHGLSDLMELRKELVSMKKTLDSHSELFKKTFEYVRQMEEIPIGAIMYSHNCPNLDLWLPFGGDVIVYADEDYPELAELVRSWNNSALIVDDEHFRLSDGNDKNRYVFAASSSKPSGRFMESQLPNIDYLFTTANGVTVGKENGTKTAGMGGSRASSVGNFTIPKTRINLAEANPKLFKNNTDQVYGDSISIHCWIKAKKLEIGY